jgi:hypothetical protein
LAYLILNLKASSLHEIMAASLREYIAIGHSCTELQEVDQSSMSWNRILVLPAIAQTRLDINYHAFINKMRQCRSYFIYNLYNIAAAAAFAFILFHPFLAFVNNRKNAYIMCIGRFFLYFLFIFNLAFNKIHFFMHIFDKFF